MPTPVQPVPLHERPLGDAAVQPLLGTSQVLNSLLRLPVRHPGPPPSRSARQNKGYEGLGKWEHVRYGLSHVEADLHAMAGIFRALSDVLEQETATSRLRLPFIPRVVSHLHALGEDLSEALDRIEAQPIEADQLGTIEGHVIDLALMPSSAAVSDLGIDLCLQPGQIDLRIDQGELETSLSEHPAEAARSLRQAADELDQVAADLETWQRETGV